MMVFKIGTQVNINQNDTKQVGMVNAISIAGKNSILYEVIWWNSNTRVKEWLNEHEVEKREDSQKQKIGFYNE